MYFCVDSDCLPHLIKVRASLGVECHEFEISFEQNDLIDYYTCNQQRVLLISTQGKLACITRGQQ